MEVALTNGWAEFKNRSCHRGEHTVTCRVGNRGAQMAMSSKRQTGEHRMSGCEDQTTPRQEAVEPKRNGNRQACAHSTTDRRMGDGETTMQIKNEHVA